MGLGSWQTWHRIFEGMTAIGTVGATVIAVWLALLGSRRAQIAGRQRQLTIQAAFQRQALLELQEIAAEWSSVGGGSGLDRLRAKALLRQLQPDQATMSRLVMDGMAGLDEAQLRRELGIDPDAPLDTGQIDSDRMVDEIARNISVLKL